MGWPGDVSKLEMEVYEDIGPHGRAMVGEEETRIDSPVAFTAVFICSRLRAPWVGQDFQC